MSFSESLTEIVAKNPNGLLAKHPTWDRVELGRVATVINGFPFPSTAFSTEQGTPLIRIRDVGADDIQTFVDHPVEPPYWVEAGDLLVGMDGDFRCRAWRGPRAALNQRVCKLVPDERLIDRRFLLHSVQGYLSAIQAATSAITVKHLSSRTIAEIPLPFPPLPEQRRIVAAIEEHLSELDAGVAALKRVQANLKRYRASVLKAAVEGRLVGTREPRRIKTVSLGEVAQIQGGIQKQPSRAPKKHIYPFLRVANVPRGRLDLEEVHKIELFPGELERLRLEPGDMLVVEGNGSSSEIGRAAIWSGEIPNCVHQNHLIRVRPGPKMSPAFLELFWNSPVGAAQVAAVASSTSGLFTLSVRKISSLQVPVPTLEQQQLWATAAREKLDALDRLNRDVAAQLRRADRLRQSILKRAFEGKLVPQDPKDEPAGVMVERVKADAGGEAPRKAGRGARNSTAEKVSGGGRTLREKKGGAS